jgi:hypothetical protein
MAFHLSSRFFDLPPVLATIAADRGLVSCVRHDTEVPPERTAEGMRASVAGQLQLPLVYNPQHHADHTPAVAVRSRCSYGCFCHTGRFFCAIRTCAAHRCCAITT